MFLMDMPTGKRNVIVISIYHAAVEISRDHPRYRSLVTREHMAAMVKEGVVAPTGLIAHGRGEAFDYLLGETTTEEAHRAELATAAYLLEAENPVITVNGNAAALCAAELVALSRMVHARIEVNLFHRTPGRIEKIIAILEKAGANAVLGRSPDARLEGIASDRAMCTKEGIFNADVVLIPLEDGDRAEALVRANKKVLAIDLNPLSRTSIAAHVTVVDEITRAVPNIISYAGDLANDRSKRRNIMASFDNKHNLHLVQKRICANLMK